MRICLLIRALNFGGAQRQIVALANGLAQGGHTVTVAVYYPNGGLEEFLDSKVKLCSLDKSGRWDIFSFFYHLALLIRNESPDLVYSFMEDSNSINVCLKPFYSGRKVVWGVRHSFMDLQKYEWIDRAYEIIERRLSKFADQIIFNSYAGITLAVHNGYPAQKSCVIPNGIDANYFTPNAQARIDKRKEWGIPEKDHLIGIVGRLDPMKDHVTFLRAANQLIKMNPQARFVCVGDGPVSYREKLQKTSDSLDLIERVLWVGNQQNMPSVYNALDIMVSSSSYGEGFSNVIGEAMSCGLPCVITDVGDSALIVGNMGKVVPPCAPQALAAGIEEMITLLKNIDHEKIRARVLENFGINNMVNQTEDVLLSVLKNG